MRFTLLICCLLASLFTIPAQGQLVYAKNEAAQPNIFDTKAEEKLELNLLQIQNPERQIHLGLSEKKYRTKHTVGVVLLGIGGAFIAGGVVLALSNYENNPSSPGGRTYGATDILTGVVGGCVCSVPFFITGGLLTTKYSKRHQHKALSE